MTTTTTPSSLTVRLGEYLEVRRRFGFRLDFAERVMRRFTAFADACGADFITVQLLLDWKAHYGSADNNTWSARLGMVRGFATWLQASDPRNEVPPKGLFCRKLRRSRPYIYSEADIACIVETAFRLPSGYGLRGWTYSTLFGLIAVTGLRINEALRLNNKDVDLNEDVLTVRQSKNGRSRFLPILPCTAARLRNYQAERDRLQSPAAAASGGPFFVAERGLRPTDCAARYNFAQVCQFIGLRGRQSYFKHGRGPRIHDLRHTFAVHTMLDWYRRGLNPDREMHRLSTYLGHRNPEVTYWYIEAVPELLQMASQRAHPGQRDAEATGAQP